jgi:predicted CopG family antitoxin
MNTPDREVEMVKMVRIEEDVHSRLVKRGRYEQTMSDIIRELLDIADKLDKGRK